MWKIHSKRYKWRNEITRKLLTKIQPNLSFSSLLSHNYFLSSLKSKILNINLKEYMTIETIGTISAKIVSIVLLCHRFFGWHFQQFLLDLWIATLLVFMLVFDLIFENFELFELSTLLELIPYGQKKTRNNLKMKNVKKILEKKIWKMSEN